MRTILSASLLATVACATTPPETIPEGEGECRSERLGALLGRPASQALGAEALRLSGARALRWIRPGDAVTMDYRTDRLNVHLDSRGQVERFACG